MRVALPHPDVASVAARRFSVGLIDPKATAQNNNFGNGQIPTAQDYEDLKAAQKSFSMMAAYLSGSTINVTYKNKPQRYTGGYVTEDMFKIVGVSPVLGRDFTAEDNKPVRPLQTSDHDLSGVGATHRPNLRRSPGHVGIISAAALPSTAATSNHDCG